MKVCLECQVRMKTTKSWQRYNEHDEKMERVRVRECPICRSYTYDFDDVLTKEAAEQSTVFRPTRKDGAGITICSLSEIINSMEEVYCLFCKAVIGRVKVDGRGIVLDALCNRCISDYELSIIKPRKAQTERNLR
jgi:hypothetical protein